MDRPQPSLPSRWHCGVMSSLGRNGEAGVCCFISDFPTVLLMGNQLSKSSRSRGSTIPTALAAARALPGRRHGRRAGPPGGGTGAAGRDGARAAQGRRSAALPGPARLSAAARRWSTTGWASATRRWWRRAVSWATPRQVGAGGRGCPLSRSCPQAAPTQLSSLPPRSGAAAGSDPASPAQSLLPPERFSPTSAKYLKITPQTPQPNGLVWLVLWIN